MTAPETPAAKRSDHWRLMAGWSYRETINSGCIVYRDPETRLWHAAKEAIAILDERKPASLERTAIWVGS